MKVAPRSVEAFLKKPDKDIMAILVYGPDTGLVSEHAETLGKTVVPDLNDPFSVVDIPPDSIKGDNARLNDEIMAMSFVGGRRLIRMRDAENDIAAALKEVFRTLPPSEQNALVIVTAGDLSATSALRKLFEAGNNLAAIACYKDDSLSLNKVIAVEFSKRGIASDRDAISLLAANCQGDRKVVMSEIEKLSLYLGDKKRVTIDEVAECIGETTESSFDDICNAVAMGDYRNIERHLRKALLQGAMPAIVLIVVQSYFSRLHSVIGMINSGMAQEQAISSLRPPVFFKQLPLFRQHVSRFAALGSKVLWNISEALYQAEIECKKTGNDAGLMCSYFLMKAASLSRTKVA